MKPGPFFSPLRVAVTGKTVSPPLFGSIVALGRAETIKRLKNAQQLFSWLIQLYNIHEGHLVSRRFLRAPRCTSWIIFCVKEFHLCRLKKPP